MELVLRGLQWETLHICLDNVIVLGRGMDESLDRLAQVFSYLHSYGLRLKPSKCHLLQEEVLFLGHIVGGDGIRPNPALVQLLVFPSAAQKRPDAHPSTGMWLPSLEDGGVGLPALQMLGQTCNSNYTA